MSLKAVIFDLDDTLLDTGELLDARDRRAWSEVFGGLDAVRIFEVSEAESPVTSLPRKVRGRGLGVSLYTHSPAKYATELLRAHGVVVDAMVTGSDRLPPKPDPTGLLVVARALGVRPEECIYVGDSVGDFGAAAAAGMTSIGVAWTGRVPESWRHGWPDVAVDKPSNVLRFIDGGEGLGLLGEVLTENKQPAGPLRFHGPTRRRGLRARPLLHDGRPAVSGSPFVSSCAAVEGPRDCQQRARPGLRCAGARRCAEPPEPHRLCASSARRQARPL